MCRLQESALIKYGPIKCTFTDILRVDDFKNRDGNAMKTIKYELKASDVVSITLNIQCEVLKYSDLLLKK